MELLGEYVGPDGRRQKLRVSCGKLDDADPYRGLLLGLAQMREMVVELLDPVVQREAQDPLAEAENETWDGDDEDDAEDENNIDNRTNSDGPSAKRQKPPS